MNNQNKPILKKFDTKVQYLKYKVLREVARHTYDDDNLVTSFNDIAKTIVKDKATMRCCIYKERAIVGERIGMAGGGHKNVDNIIEVLDIACDECPVAGYEVTHMCRGCLAHRCEDVCKRGAITFDENQKAHIDKDKCVQSGMCAKVCPYSAIIHTERPCVKACKVKAISMNEDHAAVIDDSKCINCGACVYQCPWGAITDKSYIVEVVEMLKKYANDDKVKLYVEKNFPMLKENISHNPSPMAAIAKYIKKNDPDCKVVFIGPCTAKKAEIRKDGIKEYVDSALTFEELQALFDAREIDLTELEESELNNASYYGRIFARCGGLAEAVQEALKEQGNGDFELHAVSCDGIDECRTALLKASKGIGNINFIEGMACVGGCIGGAGCLTHGPKNKTEVDKYGKLAMEKSITDAIKNL